LFVAAIVAYFALPKPPARYQASEFNALIPEPGDDFSDYVAESRTRIRRALRTYYFNEEDAPFRGLYSLDEVARMRAPFEHQPASNCESSANTERIGILMLHGLSDSPYLLKPLANNLAFRFPCALIRGLLTPGHGTVPGDLLNTNYDEWRDLLDFGVTSFDGAVDRLLVLGYSNGSTLILDYLNRYPEQEAIDQLILLSPGLAPAYAQSWSAPFLKWVIPWVNENDDEDAVKYESFPTHAASEFYLLTNRVRGDTEQQIDLPALLFLSAADTTVSAQSALDYYCQWMDNGDSKMFLFGRSQDTAILPGCDSVETIPEPDPTYANGRYLGYSHVALTVPATDPHYGLDAAYPACLAYFENRERYEQCMTDDASAVYGENSLRNEQGLVNGKLLRRSTFNPQFDRVVDEIACFVGGDC